jgi:murein DD-endopeptidase MepM/ murein hydrolase activator NlpD
MKHSYTFFMGLLVLLVTFSSCTTTGPSGIFGKKTAHEAYEDKLKNAGLAETALGRQWLRIANNSITSPLAVNLPYSETGYFSAETPTATGLKFSAKRGEKLTIHLSKKPTTGFVLYLDLWQPGNTNSSSPKLIASADTTQALLQYDVKEGGLYIVRLQPELLVSGEYTLSITNGPSLAFPVTSKVKSSIASFWGANRDAGARSHEGIDIFAPKRTALVAAANGLITGVNENNLGGKVVFLRPDDKDYTLYYAHLDEQLVQQGQRVNIGDTIGLMGNTGNAKGGSAHLHFGIYTNGGAIDPLPFVNRVQSTPAKTTASLQKLTKLARITKATTITGNAVTNSIDANTLVKIEAATENKYKVVLPDGSAGFISSGMVADALKPIRRASITTKQPLLNEPARSAPSKTIVKPGETVSILAAYNNYYYVQKGDQEGWLPKEVL